MASDTFYPQNPEPWNGDKFVNTTHSGGSGDIFFDILSDNNQETLWDILNDSQQSTLWDILNTNEQDTLWDILNATDQDTSWDILNCAHRTTAWHIFPATIPYINKFCLAGIQFNFVHNLINFEFELGQITKSYILPEQPVHDMTISLLAPPDPVQIKPVQYDFELRTAIQTVFTITRIYTDQYDTPEYPSV